MADSIGILRFFLSLAVGAIMIFVAQSIMIPILNKATPYTQGTDAQQGTLWLEFSADYLPFVFLGIAFFGFIAYSVFVRQGVLGQR